MSKNKIKLTICNMPCSLISDDTEDYVLSVGKEVEKAIEDITRQSDRASTTMAAIITALNFCDSAHKANEDADHLRAQVKDYVEELEAARKREQELTTELEALRARTAENEALRTQAAELESLRAQAAETESLRARVSELEGLQVQAGETEALRARVNELEGLQVQAGETEALRARVNELEGLQTQANETEALRNRISELEAALNAIPEEVREEPETAPIQRPTPSSVQKGSFSNPLKATVAPEQEGFMSFFEKP